MSHEVIEESVGGVEGPYLDTLWQTHRKREGPVWTHGHPKHNNNGVFVHLCLCAACKRGSLGTPFSTKANWFLGLMWGEVGGGGRRGRVGLHPNPAHSQRTSYGDLWPQHQPTCLEFHYRRGKTDGGHGGLRGFGGSLFNNMHHEARPAGRKKPRGRALISQTPLSQHVFVFPPHHSFTFTVLMFLMLVHCTLPLLLYLLCLLESLSRFFYTMTKYWIESIHL